MNYDTILVEMLSRIQNLEETVRVLSEEQKALTATKQNIFPEKRVTTADIRSYIDDIKCAAANNGNKYLVIKSNDIHKAMKLRSRLPMVCNAMRQSMGTNDEILYKTASGYSSTFEVKYDLSEWRETD